MDIPLFSNKTGVIMFDGGEIKSVSNPVADDILLTIFYNNVKQVTLNCSPCDLHKLAAGYLFYQGIVKAPSDIFEIKLREAESSIENLYRYDIYCRGKPDAALKPCNMFCGLRRVDADSRYSADQLLQLINKLENRSSTFRITGGVHSAALAGSADLLAVFEDIGRYNAVDKVLGHLFLENIFAGDKCLLLTGRTAPEIVFKAACGGIPMIVSRSAPTRLAIEQSERLGVSLAGFARGRKLYIFSHAEKVIP